MASSSCWRLAWKVVPTRLPSKGLRTSSALQTPALTGNIDGVGFRGSRGLQLCGLNDGCHDLTFLRT